MRTIQNLGMLILALVFATATMTAQAKTTKMDKMAKMDKKETAYKGYLVDKMCATGFTKSGDVKKATEKAKKHTSDCALEDHCQASGYGLVIDGKFHKFTAAGDTLALSYLNKTKRENDIYVSVMGTAKGDQIDVTSIKDAKE